MSIFGTNPPAVAQSVAGLSQAEKIEAREKRPEKPTAAQRRTRREETDLVTVDTETAAAVRNLKGNDQEEAREDRQEHPPYTGRGSLSQGDAQPKLDVEG